MHWIPPDTLHLRNCVAAGCTSVYVFIAKQHKKGNEMIKEFHNQGNNYKIS